MAPTPINIDWEEMLVDRPLSPEPDVYFASPSSAPHAAGTKRARPRGAARASPDDEWRPGASSLRQPRFGELFTEIGRRVGGRLRLPRAEPEPEARRPMTRAAAKAAADLGRNARPADGNVFKFSPDDELREYKSRFSVRKKNYGRLDGNNGKVERRYARRNPISVDKMYSSKPASTTLSGNQQRVHAIDPEDADHEKCEQRGNFSVTNLTKRRKEELQDSPSLYIQKVRDVVLLDDEDMQPEEEMNCGMFEKHCLFRNRNEPKIYYPSRDDPEAVELTSSDIKCLDPEVFLSSPVINYYIQYIKRTRLHSEDCRDRFYIFNTYFYRKLEEALSPKGDFSKLRRWWKGVNIFHRAYIILPIHGMSHWSLIIICMPSKMGISGPIILHLDSLGMHPSSKIFNVVRRYLEEEWCYLKQNPSSDTSFSKAILEDHQIDIHMEKVEVPQQNNAYDCGIFMLYYIERFIGEAPERFTRDKLDMFNRGWFKSEDASELRQKIRKLLLEEFVSANLDDAMPDTDTTGYYGSDEDIIMDELEADAPFDSSEMEIEVGVGFEDTGKGNGGIKVAATKKESGESGDAGKSNEGINVAASDNGSGDYRDIGKINESIKVVASEEASGESGDAGSSYEGSTEVAALDEAPASSYKRDEKTVGCVQSEAATFSDSGKDEEDPVKEDCDSSKAQEEEGFVTSSPERSRNNEVDGMPIPYVVCDSCDSDTDELEIIKVNHRTNWRD